MKTLSAFFVAVLVFAFQMPDVAAGKNASGKNGPGKKPTPQSTPVKATAPQIKSVSADSITVQNGTRTRTYKITNFTSIELNGSKVSVSALKPGMPVTVEAGVDETVAQSISAGHVQ